MRGWIMTQLRRWIVHWHGEGEAHQQDVYRCTKCHRLVTWVLIRQGGCLCGVKGVKIEAFEIRWWHIARLLLLPWTVTKRRKIAQQGEALAKIKDWSNA